ncbi:MAG: NosD domain-containing protein [bacterium]|nr:NosD domain-containing protein [bacterium]
MNISNLKSQFFFAPHLVLAAVFVAGVFLFADRARAQELPSFEPSTRSGVVEGTSANFSITDSAYLNISLDSTEVIKLRMESVPNMVTMTIESPALLIATSTQITLYGFTTSTTYYKYEDNYHNLTQFTTDENGAYSYTQDISTPHIVFIQTHKSTKFIRDDATGGDCTLIGNWDSAIKTCTLNVDLTETIQIDSNGITLDGNSHMLTGSNTGNGVYLSGFSGRTGVTIKNLNVKKFLNGILLRGSNNTLTNNTTTSNSYGIFLGYLSNNNTLTNNTASSNGFGIYLYFSSNNILMNNVAQENSSDDLHVQVSSDSHCDNSITNTIGSGGRPIRYFNSAVTLSNETFSELILCNAGGSNINNITIDGSITKKNNGLFLIQTSSSTIANVNSSNNNSGIYLDSSSSNNVLTNNIASNNNSGILLYGSSNNNTLTNNTVLGNNFYGILFSLSSNNILTNNTASNNNVYGIYLFSSNNNQVYNNNLIGNFTQARVNGGNGNVFNLTPSIGGNYWSNFDTTAEGCSDSNNDNFCDSPYIFYGGQDNLPWTTQDGWNNIPPPCTADCYSNVLFLPGMMGSRLFEKSSDCGVFNNEKERWVSILDCNHQRLVLNGAGKSINSLYTKEGTAGVIDEVYASNIYQSFINDLKKWKEADHIINDYSMIAYDWRLSLEDILQNGATSTDGISYSTPQGFTNSYLYKQLKILADSSKTQKVTIVAHSNGGLVTKALIQKLKEANDPLYDRIDNVIFVAVPQAGTPDTVGQLLHGGSLGPLGFLMDAERVRDLLHNMPTGYNLLPSRAYIGSSTPLIEFGGNAVSPVISARYGDTIDTYDELADYLTGGDGRAVPAYDDLSSPAIGNSTLLSNAETIHATLDQWTPATSTMVYEIAGWGIYTPAVIRYEKNKVCIPRDPPSTPQTIGAPQPIICERYVDVIKIQDKVTLNGDKTVVEESAHLMPTSSMTQKWWVDLGKYNNLTSTIDREHKNILEVDPLRSFIHSIVISSSTPEQYITNDSSLLVSTKPYIKYQLHSPLNLNIYDQAGNHTGISTTTGLIEEGIKGSTYYTLGDTKIIIVSADTLHTVKLDAYASGSFTLDLEELRGDIVMASTTYEAIPTATTTQVTLTWTGVLSTTTTLAIDFNNDNTIDSTLKPTLGGTTIYDATPPEARFTFDPAANKFFITGIDNLSSTTVNTTATSTTITDEAGNTTNIPFLEYEEEPTEIKVVFNTIIYNGIATATPKTTLEYEWKFKNDILKSLSQEIHLKDMRKIETKYKQAINETKIVDEVEEGKSKKIKISKPGIAVVTVMTDKGQLLVGY